MQQKSVNISTLIFRLSLAVWVAFMAQPFFGQQVNISGTAPGRQNTLVRIITYADQFSRLEKTNASAFTDWLGNFTMEFDVEKTDYAFLAVGLKRSEFYISPNASYQFQVKQDTSKQKGSIFDELPLQFTYTAEDDGLSDAITDFNVQNNTFLYENANRIYYGRNKDFIVDYKSNIREKFKSVDNDYLKNYIRYSFASLEWSSKMKDSDSIVAEYFYNNPILYNNIQYTEFFTEFFKTYFIAEKVFAYNDLIDAINYGKDMQAVKSLIERKNMFENDTELADLLAVVLVAKKYYNPDVIRKRVIGLLNEVKNNGKYEEIRKIAENFIQKLQNLEYGTKAPDFSLPDINNVKHSLTDFDGKFLLLSFIKPDCNVCLEHLQLLDELENKYPSEIQNVTIVNGDRFPEVVKYASERDFDWPFLNLDHNILLLEAYNIRAYPSYVIINPDGTISMATAPMPDENLEIYLQRQMKRFKELNNEK